jgi:hypothetical protein
VNNLRRVGDGVGEDVVVQERAGRPAEAGRSVQGIPQNACAA